MTVDSTFTILESAIGAANKRNEVISENIANVNTPGYKRGRVSFEEQLKRALTENSTEGKVTQEKHIPIGQTVAEIAPRVVREDSQFMRNDDNNVDIDVEMAELNKNTLHHNALVRQLNSKIGRLRTAIQEN